MTTLLVTSVGGHLAELRHLLPRFEGLDPDRLWVTFETPQSRSLLDGEDVLYVDYTAPRDVKNVVRHSALAMRLFRRRHPFKTVLSTGSGIALSFLPLARARGASCHFIESGARSVRPSLTGRLLSRVPGIALYSQYPGWQSPWRYEGSVLDGYVRAPRAARPSQVRRVVVTLGTNPYSFLRLVRRTIDILPPEAELTWQVGVTDVNGLPIQAQRWKGEQELQSAIEAADVVIAHAGMGSALGAMDAGKCPILVPRRKQFGENVDDHQFSIASELVKRDLAIVRSVEDLTTDDVYEAAARSVQPSRQPPPFRLVPRR